MDEEKSCQLGSGERTMGTTLEVRPPGSLIVKMELAKNVPVELVLEKNIVEVADNGFRMERVQQLRRNVNNVLEAFEGNRERLANELLLVRGSINSIESFQAPDVSVPVTIDPDSLPYTLLAGTRRNFVTPEAATISVQIIEKRNIRIKLRNLQFLKDVFGEDASMKLIVSHDGALETWQTEEMEIHDLNSEAEGSVWLSEDVEDLINQYGSRKRYRTAHGEVVSVIGSFTILAKWTINARPKEVCAKLDRHQKLIMSEPFDHQVELVSSDGKTFKVSKAMLAAYSEKIETQLQFSPIHATNPRNFKSIQIFSGAYFDDDTCHHLDENGLRALIRYVVMSSISMPLEDPKLCLDLMMTANYNLIRDLEKAMAQILLAQPLELFDVETSIHLYWFASLRMEMEKHCRPSFLFWDRLRCRAWWNLKWTSIEDLLASPVINELVLSPTEEAIREFMTTIKVEDPLDYFPTELSPYEIESSGSENFNCTSVIGEP